MAAESGSGLTPEFMIVVFVFFVLIGFALWLAKKQRAKFLANMAEVLKSMGFAQETESRFRTEHLGRELTVESGRSCRQKRYRDHQDRRMKTSRSYSPCLKFTARFADQKPSVSMPVLGTMSTPYFTVKKNESLINISGEAFKTEGKYRPVFSAEVKIKLNELNEKKYFNNYSKLTAWSNTGEGYGKVELEVAQNIIDDSEHLKKAMDVAVKVAEDMENQTFL